MVLKLAPLCSAMIRLSSRAGLLGGDQTSVEYLEAAHHGAKIAAALLHGGTAPATIDVHEIVHAAIVLGHHHHEVGGDAVERSLQLRFERCTPREGELFFPQDATIGEMNEQVLDERAQRDIVTVLSAASRNGDGAASLVVPKGDERFAGVHTPSRRGYGTEAKRKLWAAVDAAVEGGA